MDLITTDNQMNVTIAEGVRIIGCSLTITPAAKLDQVEKALKTLVAMNRVNQWCLGDLVNIGELRFKEQFSQIIDVSGLQYSTLQVYASMAKSFKPEERRNISFEHHRIVQKYEMEKRLKYLQVALDNDMRVPEFRNYVNKMEGKAKTGTDDPRARKFVVAKRTAPISRGDIWDILSDETNKSLSEEDLFQLGLDAPDAQDSVIVICVRFDDDAEPNMNQANLDLADSDASVEAEAPFG